MDCHCFLDNKAYADLNIQLYSQGFLYVHQHFHDLPSPSWLVVRNGGCANKRLGEREAKGWDFENCDGAPIKPFQWETENENKFSERLT